MIMQLIISFFKDQNRKIVCRSVILFIRRILIIFYFLSILQYSLILIFLSFLIGLGLKVLIPDKPFICDYYLIYFLIFPYFVCNLSCFSYWCWGLREYYCWGWRLPINVIFWEVVGMAIFSLFLKESAFYVFSIWISLTYFIYLAFVSTIFPLPIVGTPHLCSLDF